MGEITWFMSLMKHLENQKNIKVIHCPNILYFKKSLIIFKDFNPYLIMDYLTIPKTINFIDLNKTYCMCYWGRDENRIKLLGNKNGKFLSLKKCFNPI